MNSSFSLQRVSLLIKRYFKENLKVQIIIWIVLIIAFMGSVPFNIDFTFVIYLFGFMLATSQFSIFVISSNCINYLMIPASMIEKVVSSIFICFVYYFFALASSYIIGNLISNVISSLYTHTPFSVSFDFLTLKGMKILIHKGEYYNLSIWNLMGVVSIIQACGILVQLATKPKTVLSIFAGILVILPVIFFGQHQVWKTLIWGENASVDWYDRIYSSVQTTDSTLTLLIAISLISAMLWRINYSLLSNKQL